MRGGRPGPRPTHLTADPALFTRLVGQTSFEATDECLCKVPLDKMPFC